MVSATVALYIPELQPLGELGEAGFALKINLLIGWTSYSEGSAEDTSKSCLLTAVS